MNDLLIIGGGPAGYVAAERAGKAGLNVVLFEKKSMGGVCLNEGCIPTKTLLYSAKVYENALNSDKYGVFVDGADFNLDKVVSRKKKVVRKLVLGVDSKMRKNNVEVVKGEAYIESKTDEGISVICNDQKYLGKNLLICTGSEPFIPNIPGLEVGEAVLTSREILNLKEKPESLVIIGGGVIGIEFASFFNSIGTKVSVVEMFSEILGGMDSELSAMLRGIYEKKGVEFYLNSRVTSVDGRKVLFEKDNQTFEIEGDKVLVCVGRKPIVKNIGLENINVELDKNGIKVDQKMRTSVPNVYAAGDVTGFSLLAHTASREGEVVVNNLTGYNNDIMRYNAIPSVVYTSPELSGVGETEKSAKQKGLDYKVSKLPLAYSGRFVAENEGGTGVCKILVGSKYREVIGLHILGSPSSEMIFGAAMAIEQELTLNELREVVFPHPTVSEILKEVAFGFDD